MRRGLAQIHIILIVVAVVIAILAFPGNILSRDVLRAPVSYDSGEVLDDGRFSALYQIPDEGHEIGKKRPVQCLWNPDLKSFDCRGERKNADYNCGEEFAAPGYDGDMHPLPAECDVDEVHFPDAILDAWNGAANACDGDALRDIGCTQLKIKGYWGKGECRQDADEEEPVLLTEARVFIYLACTRP